VFSKVECYAFICVVFAVVVFWLHLPKCYQCLW